MNQIDPTHKSATQNEPPRIYKLVNLIFDRIWVHTRILLWPFFAVHRLIHYVMKLSWILSNEYSKRRFAHCGVGVRIYGKFHVTAPSNFYVGDNVHINSNAFLRAEGGLHIGDNVHISSNVVIYTINHNHTGGCLPYDHTTINKAVHIGKNAWIGMNAVIVPGVTIGEGAIVAMGAVVSSDVQPLAVVGSAKQRQLKLRDVEHYQKLESKKLYGGMSGYLWRSPSKNKCDPPGER